MKVSFHPLCFTFVKLFIVHLDKKSQNSLTIEHWGPLELAGLSYKVIQWLCGSLCNPPHSGLLGSKQHRPGQEETEKGGQESQFCPGLPTGLFWGGKWEEDLGKTEIDHGQHLSPTTSDSIEALSSFFSSRVLHAQYKKGRIKEGPSFNHC